MMVHSDGPTRVRMKLRCLIPDEEGHVHWYSGTVIKERSKGSVIVRWVSGEIETRNLDEEVCNVI